MDWDEIVQKSKKTGASPLLILREEIQKAALTSLSRMGAFNHIVFQGGTALRMFYHNPRFSEDLDFVLREDESFDLTSKIREINRFLSSEFFYLTKTEVKTQKNTNEIQRMVIRTVSENPYQRLSINVELFFIPSYLNSPKILKYPPLNPVIRVEKIEEILADKIIALSFREYLKGRDIWDIFYLTSELRTSVSTQLLNKKIRDYSVKGAGERIRESRGRLLRDGVDALNREMKRFMPASTYNQLKTDFNGIVEKVASEILRYTNNRGGMKIENQ